MTTYFAEGAASTVLTDDDLRRGLYSAMEKLPKSPQRVLALPPDNTRFFSRAGALTCQAFDYFGAKLTDVMPALGTHYKMTEQQLDQMFPGLPHELVREHDWRNDVVTVGEVPSQFVESATNGIYKKSWPAQLNKLVWEGGHDLILSIGQVVPHEVIGMANHNKNVFIGTGGVRGINESHFLSAACGMENIMGRADTPLRRLLNYAEENFCQHLPIVYVLTVVAIDEAGNLVTRGLFIGDDQACFVQASELAATVNVNVLDQELDNVVVHLDEDEFHSTWLGNKSIYRTRMAIADGGQLTVLAPGVRTFGEDPQIDALIRKYGYRPTTQVMKYVDENADLQSNLSAAAHLIHGTSEGRFRITYCPGHLSQAEIEGVGYDYADLATMEKRYPVKALRDGWNVNADGERFFYVSKPSMGLWATRSRFH